MKFLAPAIALLKPMSGRMRFWILPLPLLLVVMAAVIVLMFHDDKAAQQFGGLIAALLVALLVWMYLQVAFFAITKEERDRTEGAMRLAAQGDLTHTVNVGI